MVGKISGVFTHQSYGTELDQQSCYSDGLTSKKEIVLTLMKQHKLLIQLKLSPWQHIFLTLCVTEVFKTMSAKYWRITATSRITCVMVWVSTKNSCRIFHGTSFLFESTTDRQTKVIQKRVSGRQLFKNEWSKPVTLRTGSTTDHAVGKAKFQPVEWNVGFWTRLLHHGELECFWILNGLLIHHTPKSHASKRSI